jgi:hypothetical protein
MQIRDFIADRDAVEKWLTEAARSIEEEGFYLSHWYHDADPGFGLVITADRSGEFHLMANGDVISHVERYNDEKQDFEIVEATQHPTAHLHELEQLYASFRKSVTSHA